MPNYNNSTIHLGAFIYCAKIKNTILFLSKVALLTRSFMSTLYIEMNVSIYTCGMFISHARDVSIECFYRGSANIRLVNEGASYGRGEFYHNGQWGTVCDD